MRGSLAALASALVKAATTTPRGYHDPSHRCGRLPVVAPCNTKISPIPLPSCFVPVPLVLSLQRGNRLDFDDPAFHGNGYGVSAVVRPEFREDAPHVRLDGFLRNGKVIGDDFVGVAGGDLA
jgi:hypothetical protein